MFHTPESCISATLHAICFSFLAPCLRITGTCFPPLVPLGLLLGNWRVQSSYFQKEIDSISFVNPFILMIQFCNVWHSIRITSTSSYCWMDRQAESQNRNPLFKTGSLFCASSQPFLLWMHQFEKWSSPLGKAHPLNYNHTQRTHYIQSLSQIFLVPSTLLSSHDDCKSQKAQGQRRGWQVQG